MRWRACLHADEASRKIGNEADYFQAPKLAAHQNDAITPDRVNLKTLLAKSNPTVTTSCFICRLLDADLQRPQYDAATQLQSPSTPSGQWLPGSQ